MTTEPRVVFDTNAIVSAVLIRRSVPRRAFDIAAERRSNSSRFSHTEG
jgi:predicted nucleic acid-binding protein